MVVDDNRQTVSISSAFASTIDYPLATPLSTSPRSRSGRDNYSTSLLPTSRSRTCRCDRAASPFNRFSTPSPNPPQPHPIPSHPAISFHPVCVDAVLTRASVCLLNKRPTQRGSAQCRIWHTHTDDGTVRRTAVVIELSLSSHSLSHAPEVPLVGARSMVVMLSSPLLLKGCGRGAPLIRWVIAAFLACGLLPFLAFAQFTEMYPFVKTAVAFDHNSTAYFTRAETNTIHAVILATGVQITYSVNNSLSRPSGLAVDADGSLLIADTGNHRIVRLNTTTGLLTAAYTTTSEPALHWPCDVAVSSVDGSVLIADTWNHRIVKLSSKGEQLAVFTTSSPSLHYPAGGECECECEWEWEC